ncbi:MAG: fused MFS/spermidine synthase [Elusimicrobia bacterium]|nr:fused MFS/spermidine synthase [Elusimicrobiota bacterium]
MSSHHILAFAGSFLLFQSELLMAKLLLPHFGGSAQVWTVCMMFFLAALLAGYLYAHLAGTRLSPRGQAWLHLAVLASAALAFPLAAVPYSTAHPVAALLAALGASIGAPFIALSATVPTLQRWLTHSARPERTLPYSLYAASNAGALAGLIGYPFLIEPLLPLDSQVRAWQACYALFAAGHLLCLPKAAPWVPAAPPEQPAIPRRRLLAWVALAAGPCAAMLAATQYLSSTLAAVPLIWVVPLGIYLATIVLNFKATPWRPYGCVLFLVVGLALGPLLLAVLGHLVMAGCARVLAGIISFVGLALNVAALFIIAMICHRSLSEDKPSQEGLSSLFYLCLALGGLVGGVLLAVGVPWLGRRSGLVGLDWLVAGAVSLSALVLRDWELWRSKSVLRPSTLLGAFLMIFVFFFTARASVRERAFALRNFYGIYKIEDDGRLRMLMHGNTLHGMQYRDPALSSEPLAYYHRLGPIGDVFRLFGAGLHSVGVIGLGTGNIAAYGGPGMSITFYELDPDVLAIARDRFSFLAQTKAAVRTVIGDARLSLASSEDARYDLIVVDAFSAGAIPMHLLTREAFELYARRLAPGGLILVQASNKHIDLRPALAAQAQAFGVRGLIRHAVPPEGMGREYYLCQWVALSKDPGKVKRLEETRQWEDLSRWKSRFVSAWTDRHASVLPLIRL